LRNSAPFRTRAKYVMYWASANRRVDSNHALAFAAELANEHNLPVLFYEGLTCSHPWANDRFHTFILEGVPENARRAQELGIGYVFYLRRSASDPNDIVYRLAAEAAAVVTDEFPAYIPREFNDHVPRRIDVPYYTVDASCIVPMAAIGKQEHAAYTIRPKIHKLLATHLRPLPPVRVRRPYRHRHPEFHTEVRQQEIPTLVASCEIDHSVGPSRRFQGGRRAAQQRFRKFLAHNLRHYAELSRKPSADATSHMSPYLHFGHISSLELALAAGGYAGKHNFSAAGFLEQLIVRRELAYNFARYGPSPFSTAALPNWAQATLTKHARDSRPAAYTRKEFEQAKTHDPLWNAAQTELLREGEIHGYYRMYWGKKILEWSETPQDALDTMIFLNDRYALDGRDPNTYSNLLWCLGLHDRPWRERPVFGMIRYMSLDGMRRKTDVKAYIESPSGDPG
jgi:deoxyribodipyrimidine photo-lyase